MFRKALYFFTEKDEAEVSAALIEAFPNIKFVDGQRWKTADPPLVDGIHLCRSSLTYLWPSDLVPVLPSKELPPERQYDDIRFQGPIAGPVIQFHRCRKKKGELEFSQAEANIGNPVTPEGKWHSKVIAFLKRRYRFGLDCIDSKSGQLLTENLREYLVGKSIQENWPKAPRLVLGLGRDQSLVPHRSRTSKSL